MITVVTLNPSIDRTLMLDAFHPGQTNRVRQSRVDAGGKGVNVCVHLRALGAERVCCVGWMRSADEGLFSDRLEKAGVEQRWIVLPGHVRVNTKVCAGDGQLTELNEAGAEVPPWSIDALIEACREVFPRSKAVVLTGSVPPGVPKDIYAKLTRLARAAGAFCLLDADGAALAEGLKAGPDCVKPNRAELERLLGEALADETALLTAARRLQSVGVGAVCISLGDQGARYIDQSEALAADAIPVPVLSTVGAGDAMVAGLALAVERNMPARQGFAAAVAAGTAAVVCEGTQPLDRKTYDQALMRVQLRKWRGDGME